jgi:hypothetical protein
MLFDRPIPKALFYSHARLEAKRNGLDALSGFGTSWAEEITKAIDEHWPTAQ